MMRSPGRLLAFATVLAVTLILIFQQTTEPRPDSSLPEETPTLVRSTLKVTPRAPNPIPEGNPSHLSAESRPPYAVLSPVAPIHKTIGPHDTPGEQYLLATVSLDTGSLLCNQSFDVELILYRPKPDVIYTGVVTTDDRGRFSVFVGNDYRTTTSLSLHMSSTTKAYRTGLLSTTHYAQAPQGEEIDLGYLVLFDASVLEE